MILAVFLVLIALCLVLEAWSRTAAPKALSATVTADKRLLEQGVPFHLNYTLENTGSLPRFDVHINQYTPSSLVPEGSAEAPFTGERVFDYRTPIGPKRKRTVRIEVTGMSRGRYQIPICSLCQGDFLGLSETPVTHVLSIGEIVICPRPLIDTPDLSSALGGFFGDLSVRRFLYQDPVLFIGCREYTGQEPMKQIAWSRSARGQGLMVREMDHTATYRVSVIFDVQVRTGVFEKELFETACRMVRSVLEFLEEKGTAYAFATNARCAGAITDSRYVPEGIGERHFLSILELLGRADGHCSFSGEDLMDAALYRQGGRVGIICCTLKEPDDTVRRFVSKASLSASTVLILSAVDYLSDEEEKAS